MYQYVQNISLKIIKIDQYTVELMPPLSETFFLSELRLSSNSQQLKSLTEVIITFASTECTSNITYMVAKVTQRSWHLCDVTDLTDRLTHWFFLNFFKFFEKTFQNEGVGPGQE